MTKKIVILILIWLIYVYLDYFILPYFVQPFLWLLVCLALLILTIRQVIKIIKQRKKLNSSRILKFSLTLILLFLTFWNFNKFPHFVMEKLDWTISYSKRQQIVKDVIDGKLKSNTKMNNGICELPFNFPIVSNGGNDIWIHNYKNRKTKTIKFWISRGFFESPQTYFIYTNDTRDKKYYQKLIEKEPENNWKLKNNWYRIMQRE